MDILYLVLLYNHCIIHSSFQVASVQERFQLPLILFSFDVAKETSTVLNVFYFITLDNLQSFRDFILRLESDVTVSLRMGVKWMVLYIV